MRSWKCRITAASLPGIEVPPAVLSIADEVTPTEAPQPATHVFMAKIIIPKNNSATTTQMMMNLSRT